MPPLVARPAGALNRIFDVVQEIKQSNTYSKAISQDLRIIGCKTGAPDLTDLAPAFKLGVSGG